MTAPTTRIHSSLTVVELVVLSPAGVATSPPDRAASCPAGRRPTRTRSDGPRLPTAYSPAMSPLLGSALAGLGVQQMDPAWPPVLIFAVAVVVVGFAIVVTVMFRRL